MIALQAQATRCLGAVTADDRRLIMNSQRSQVEHQLLAISVHDKPTVIAMLQLSGGKAGG